MKGFDDMILKWGGKEYAVPANRQMELILRVESNLMRGQRGEQAASVLARAGGAPTGLLVAAYADALRYAGAEVADIEVFKEVTSNIRSGGGELLTEITIACCEILGLIGTDDDMPEPPKGDAGKKE